MVAEEKKCDKVTAEELHRRMGHISVEGARKMVVDRLVEGLELKERDQKETFCDSCAHAKMTRKSIWKEATTPRATEIGERIHANLWGPSPVWTPGQKEYYSSFTDEAARWSFVFLQRLKSKAFDNYK